MPRATCPDPALLQSYVDQTLFSRDVGAVEQHVASCERCAAILAAIQQERAAAPSSSWSPSRVAGVVLAVLAIAGIATWALRPGSNDAPPPPVLPAPVAEKPVAPAAAPAPVPVPEPAAPPPKPAPAVAERRQPIVKEQPPADVNPPDDLTDAANGVTIRGTRRSNRGVVWRARDLVIEHSTDGGKTWATEYKADRPVRAGAFVSSDVAWLVGDNGLVLRRTKNGWFGTTPPADGDIKSVRASSTGTASVTFEDGRVFTTENGGVTWSSQ